MLTYHRILITLRTDGGDLLLGSGIDSLARSLDELDALASGAFKCAGVGQSKSTAGLFLNQVVASTTRW
jgi:hypothetical protein